MNIRPDGRWFGETVTTRTEAESRSNVLDGARQGDRGDDAGEQILPKGGWNVMMTQA